MRNYLNALTNHLPAVVMVVVAVLNVLLAQKSIHLTDAWADSLNIVLAALGIAGHINNHIQ